MMEQAKWIDRFEVGGEYTYREDGAASIVRVIDKSVTGSGDSQYANISLESIRSLHGGVFGTIDAGDKWTATALLTPGGYPNAYAGWHLEASRG